MTNVICGISRPELRFGFRAISGRIESTAGGADRRRRLGRGNVLKVQRRLLFVLAFLFIFPWTGGHPTAADSRPVFTFGVVPQFEQRKLYAAWKPIIEELETRTGLAFKLVTTLKIPDFEREYMNGGFDFVYMNPYYLDMGNNPGGRKLLSEVPVAGLIAASAGPGIVHERVHRGQGPLRGHPGGGL